MPAHPDFPALRSQFPALRETVDGRPLAFFDGPGGTQAPQSVIDTVSGYLASCNANHGGAFSTSVRSDAILQAARESVADFLNAPSADEIAFGQNMTSLTFALSRAIGRTLKPGDEVLVTRLDHDANVTPWALAARDAGATVQTVDFRPEDGTLDMIDLERKLSNRTKLVAVGMASNSLGTINDVAAIVPAAHSVGAKVFVDAVHFAPHGAVDVPSLNCDYLACSAYKFFGPHVGILWARKGLLESLPAYKVRPAPDTVPDRWMTGTQNHEGIAGVGAAVEYLRKIGEQAGGGSVEPASSPSGVFKPKPAQTAAAARSAQARRDLRAAMTAIREYEAGLSKKMFAVLGAIRGLKIFGITDRAQFDRRVPTFSFTLQGRRAKVVAAHLAKRGICAWDGNFYAIGVTERLGLEKSGGLVRVGAVHYNTAEEIDGLGAALAELAAG